MAYKISADNIEELRKLPETGMGYQLIIAKNEYSFEKEFIVLNGQIAIDRTEGFNKMAMLLLQANSSSLGISSLPGIHLTNIFLKENFENIFYEPNNKSAADAKVEKANGDELFVRLSAFKDDIRIEGIYKRLLPGTYTSTVSDALRCKVEGNDPIERYALPANLLVQWAFYIQPKTGDALQRGKVEEAFGKRGGGREAFFERGTIPRTFITQTRWQHDYTSASK